MCDGVAGGIVITYIIISMRLLNRPSWLVGCDKAISTRAFERKPSWAARLTPRWPQFPVLQRFKYPNYHCTCVYHFLIAKEKKFKLGQVGVGSNITQNHSSSIQGVISGHYLPKCKSWPNIKLCLIEVGSNIAQNHSSGLYEVISGHYLPQFKWKVGQKWN